MTDVSTGYGEYTGSGKYVMVDNDCGEWLGQRGKGSLSR